MFKSGTVPKISLREALSSDKIPDNWKTDLELGTVFHAHIALQSGDLFLVYWRVSSIQYRGRDELEYFIRASDAIKL